MVGRCVCCWVQVRTLCTAMGETLTVHEYERFTPLRVESKGLQGRYRNVRPGDCIVAFSRKDIFTIKQVGSSPTPPLLPPQLTRTGYTK